MFLPEFSIQEGHAPPSWEGPACAVGSDALQGPSGLQKGLVDDLGSGDWEELGLGPLGQPALPLCWGLRGKS